MDSIGGCQAIKSALNEPIANDLADLRLVVHRGYLPLRKLEIKEGLRSKWEPCDTEGIDGIEEVLMNEARAEATAAGMNR